MASITARDVTQYSDDDRYPALAAFTQQWSVALAEGGGQFGAVVLTTERLCRDILADAVKPYLADSAEQYAARILAEIEWTKAAIARGDADEAARYAVHVGRLITEAHIKWKWERHALRGEKNVSDLKIGTGIVNKQKSKAAKSRVAKWQAMAEEIWRRNPSLSSLAVAGLIVGKIGGNVGTIRRKISKPIK